MRQSPSIYAISLDAIADRAGMSTDTLRDLMTATEGARKGHITKGGIMPHTREPKQQSGYTRPAKPNHECMNQPMTVFVQQGRRQWCYTVCCETDLRKKVRNIKNLRKNGAYWYCSGRAF